MRRSYFFPVMGYLLSCVSNATWSKEAVETLLGLSRVITSSMPADQDDEIEPKFFSFRFLYGIKALFFLLL
jgi:hypothetical protein